MVAGESWAAQLRVGVQDRPRLQTLAQIHVEDGQIRELLAEDVTLILELDAATTGHYPGTAATAHAPLDETTATPTPTRRGWGVFDPHGALVAMTFLDCSTEPIEIDFTVVAASHRGRGLGTAVKAASVLALLDEGQTTFRTGGAAENQAIILANASLGFTQDERWVTMAPR